MEQRYIACPQCRCAVSAGAATAAGTTTCRRCSQRFSVTLFPALFRESAKGRLGERVADDTQATCFYHGSRQAVVACSACGRFLCELCDLTVSQQHLCPLCLETKGAERRATDTALYQQDTILYDNLALALAVLPMLVIWPTLVTAPATLVVVGRYWRRTKPLVRRTRVRFVVATLLALAQIAGWGVMLTVLMTS